MSQGVVIAGQFRQLQQVLLKPPGQRIEPEGRAIKAGQQMNIEIMTANMGLLVQQNGVSFEDTPLRPIQWKQNRRAECRGRSELRADADVGPRGPRFL